MSIGAANVIPFPFDGSRIETGIEEAAAYLAKQTKIITPTPNGFDHSTSELKICPPVLDPWRRRRKGLPRTKLGRRVLYSRKSPQVWSSSCEHRGDTQ
jgi:hypothetical protein